VNPRGGLNKAAKIGKSGAFWNFGGGKIGKSGGAIILQVAWIRMVAEADDMSRGIACSPGT